MDVNTILNTLTLHQTYTKKEISDLLEYKPNNILQGGVVKPKKLKLIILFTTHNKEKSATPYDDKIIDNKLYMDGEKMHGSDTRLVDSRDNDIVILFYKENFFEDFIYYGEVKLHNYELKEDEPSKFIFNILNEEVIMKKNSDMARDEIMYEIDITRAMPMSDEELDKASKKNPCTEARKTKKYKKNPRIGKAVIEKAGYICELGKEEHESFISNSTHHNYMEAHHLIPASEIFNFWKLYKRNIDCSENLLSLCPLCHKKIHLGLIKDKKVMLAQLLELKKDELKSIGIEITLDELVKLYE